MLNKSTWAKIFAWLGASVTTLSVNGAFGKYSAFAGTLAAGLTALAAHYASNTSAGNPNGQNPRV